ncbi:MAG TPA: hypothetical protein VN714_00090 [Trebonia sp.]|nr:hypothetical protein [Trebonia sp.]
MTVLTALARAAAATGGRALPTKTVRHVHLADRPLVLVAAQLAGEACAPLAVLVGDDRDKPRLLVVYEPRDRTQRFEFAAELAAIMLPAIEGYISAGNHGDDGSVERSEPYPDAPQLLVPNQPTASFLQLLGRSTRFRRTEGEYAVRPSVPVLGRWLTYFSERAEVSPSSQLLPMTVVLADHWATGQSAAEDANLAALLAWISPPDGMTAREAARAAEDPVRCPPAGPVTDPTFDNEVLEPILQAAHEAALTGDTAHLSRARADMERALRGQLEPTWALMWRAIDLLRGLSPAAHVEPRWVNDRWSFTNQVAWLRDGGAPQARRDSAVAAARRLARLEREQQRLAVERAYDDPLVMAEHRMTGEAFAGDVVDADPARLDTTGKRPVLRPWITVATTDAVLFEPGAALRSPLRPAQQATVKDVVLTGRGVTQVVLELKGGMGRSLIPPPGSVPAVGDNVTYTSLKDEFQHAPKFPEIQDTPWTHGGPPPEYVPTDEDAREDWS